MDAFDSSQIGSVIETYMNGNFATISFLTFFVCEAVFAAFPVHQAKMKQLTSVVAGAVLSILMTKGAIPDALIQGILAGGATTIGVAKFKKPSAPAMIVTDAASVNVPTTSSAPITEPMPEPADHL